MEAAEDGGDHVDAGSPIDSAVGHDAALPLPPPPSPLTLEIGTGRVEGTRIGETRAFLGIPYAEPPLGELRFAPPVPKAPWSGTFVAHESGVICPQFDGPSIAAFVPDSPESEDCLTLDVYAPASPPAEGAPVLVFIPGGGFVSGGAQPYKGQSLSESGNLVVVTLNYRVGPLGFLAHPALDEALGVPSGNSGLRDQQLALRWVRDNIAAFGGDPSRVTLAGESAGSLSVCLHMVMAESQDLVDAFILQSGSCIGGQGQPWSRERLLMFGNQLVDDMCKGKSDVAACLREVPAETLANWKPVFMNLGELVLGSAMPAPWFPIVDGALIREHPLRMLRENKFAGKPLLMGTNSDEWLTLSAVIGFPDPHNKLEFELFSSLFFMLDYDVGKLMERYLPDSDAEASDAWGRMWSDLLFICPSRQLAREAAALGSDVYYYNFDVAPGAHGQELAYLFDMDTSLLFSKLPDATPIKPDTVSVIQDYWASFVRDGVPAAAGQPSWPTYTPTEEGHLRIAEPVTLENGLPNDDDCDFLERLYAKP